MPAQRKAGVYSWLATEAHFPFSSNFAILIKANVNLCRFTRICLFVLWFWAFSASMVNPAAEER